MPPYLICVRGKVGRRMMFPNDRSSCPVFLMIQKYLTKLTLVKTGSGRYIFLDVTKKSSEILTQDKKWRDSGIRFFKSFAG